MENASPIRALVVVTTRYGKNGITGVVKNYAGKIPPEQVVFDYVFINEPTPQEAEAIAARGGKHWVYTRRNRNPLGYERWLRGILRAGKYDLIHAHGNSATLFFEMHGAKKAGIPLRIAHSHNTKTGFPLVHRLLHGTFLKNTTHRLACGTAAGKWLFGDRDFTVMPNAIDTGRFTFDPADRERARRALGLGTGRVYVHVGSFIPAKNHRFLLRAFARILELDPEAALLLAGEGYLMEETRQLADALQIAHRVQFLGSGRDVKDVYAAGDVFLLPSLHEGLPLTLLEAQSMGLVCLTSDAVTREANVTGLVHYRPLQEGPEAFGEGACALAPLSEGERLSARAGVVKAGFDIESRAAELTAFYKNCLAGRN